MKYTASAGPSSLNVPSGREFVSLSPKLGAATYSDGFNQYNSPKTVPAKGFVLPKSANETPVLLRAQKNESSLTQSKAKVSKGYTATRESSTPSQKMTASLTVNTQLGPSRDDKKSSSATKLKNEGLRTVSSTPKNSSSSKNSDSVRTREDTNSNSTQYKWKKLEITTEYNNTKASYAKAQTTKHTESDENGFSKTLVTQHSQSQQKSLQAKNINTNSYASSYQQSDRKDEKAAADIRFDQKFRSNRPQSSSDKTSSVSSPKEGSSSNANSQRNTSTVKENVKVNNFFNEKETTASRPSYKKSSSSSSKIGKIQLSSDEDLRRSTPFGIKKENSTQADLRASWQASTPQSAKKSKRPLSAKKAKELKEEPSVQKLNTKGGDSTPAQKVSLNSFVTNIGKGDLFGSIKKNGEKRDSSVSKTQKPNLTIEDNKKPVKALDITPKTTSNSESKTLTVTISKPASQSPMASSQTFGQKSSKSSKSNREPVRAMQEAVVKSTRASGKEPFIYYMSSLEKAHKHTGEADYFIQVYREHFIQSYQALSFCKMLKPVCPSVVASKKVNLPKRETHKDKKTLVFDMDETLIHCNESSEMPADVILPILFPNGEVVEAGINVRPYALEILRELSHYYEIIVFTASHSCYANVVLDYLDPHEQYIHHRLFRESCVVTEEGVHIKDLRVIGNRNLEDLILVDNAAYSFGLQIENGIPIIPFYDNKADQELRHLIPYLKFLSSVKDLREINKQTFKMHHYGAHDTPEAVLERVISFD